MEQDDPTLDGSEDEFVEDDPTLFCICGHLDEDHIDYTQECCYCDCTAFKQ